MTTVFLSHIAYWNLISRTLFLPFWSLTTLLLVKYIGRIVFFALRPQKRKQQITTFFLTPKSIRRSLHLVFYSLNTLVKLTFMFFNL